ncbi:hypothetical protein ABK905_10810 [Acerihabitans sp. KWT182]|uniref:Uncharacterized protein n=1 Tax=Acerihabitans sp. KWT182 TaxID=3157919 RepID=A0AAU7QE58_9GAMM
MLGPEAELAFRQSLMLSNNNLSIFIDRPISAGILGAIVIIVLFSIYSRMKQRRKVLAMR